MPQTYVIPCALVVCGSAGGPGGAAGQQGAYARQDGGPLRGRGAPVIGFAGTAGAVGCPVPLSLAVQVGDVGLGQFAGQCSVHRGLLDHSRLQFRGSCSGIGWPGCPGRYRQARLPGCARGRGQLTPFRAVVMAGAG